MNLLTSVPLQTGTKLKFGALFFLQLLTCNREYSKPSGFKIGITCTS